MHAVIKLKDAIKEFKHERFLKLIIGSIIFTNLIHVSLIPLCDKGGYLVHIDLKENFSIFK
jgi:high-affinity K+ transport system ATPase subunit B